MSGSSRISSAQLRPGHILYRTDSELPLWRVPVSNSFLLFTADRKKCSTPYHVYSLLTLTSTAVHMPERTKAAASLLTLSWELVPLARRHPPSFLPSRSSIPPDFLHTPPPPRASHLRWSRELRRKEFQSHVASVGNTSWIQLNHFWRVLMLGLSPRPGNNASWKTMFSLKGISLRQGNKVEHSWPYEHNSALLAFAVSSSTTADPGTPQKQRPACVIPSIPNVVYQIIGCGTGRIL